MRWVRLHHAGQSSYARLVDDETAELFSDAPWLGGTTTGRLVPTRKAQLLPPVAPSKIVCVGLNYRDHAAEFGLDLPKEPLLFLKAPTTLVASGDAVVLPPESSRVDYEGELGIVIGKRIGRVSRTEAADAIFGYTCVNDVTARDLQRSDVQFTRAKCFDTFCPCGPHIETDIDPDDLAIRTTVNDALRQDGRTSQMVFPVLDVVHYIARMMTLLPGDLLCTGTPAGIGPLAHGDHVSVTIDGIGTLSTFVNTL